METEVGDEKELARFFDCLRQTYALPDRLLAKMCKMNIRGAEV